MNQNGGVQRVLIPVAWAGTMVGKTKMCLPGLACPSERLECEDPHHGTPWHLLRKRTTVVAGPNGCKTPSKKEAPRR